MEVPRLARAFSVFGLLTLKALERTIWMPAQGEKSRNDP